MKSTTILLVDIVHPRISKEDSAINLKETLSLIETYDGGKLVEVFERRVEPHPGTYIGSGKIEEISYLIQKKNIEIVIINTIAKPTQLYELLQAFWVSNPTIQVWDRVDLILHIFSKHARTAEAKLQIDLAKMRHMGPRMYGLAKTLGRQAGGIGGRGIGETNVELMKRHWRSQMKQVKDELAKLTTHHKQQLERRRREGFKTVSIVGYTNAGKTTLFNILTNKKNYAKNELFATLDSAVGHIYLTKSTTKVMITDTIGFIQDLPTSLIDAFKSTLMESIHADALLHVIDVSDPRMNEKKRVVEQILTDLGIHDKPIINVLNKYDAATSADKSALDKGVPAKMIVVSAQTGKGIEELKEMIGAELSSRP
ncbi:MAG: GTPase HflX [bacterium]|nr:GTPase HflX [bacterium]